MHKHRIYEILLTLGIVWVLVGYLIYENQAIAPLGFLFLLIGLIGRFGSPSSAKGPDAS